MTSFFHWLHCLLEHPVKVAFLGVIIAFSGLLFQGTLIELWNLKSEKWRLEKRVHETTKVNEDLRFKIDQARTSDKFIGRQAREKLDLVKEDELVFIFEDGDGLETPITAR